MKRPATALSLLLILQVPGAWAQMGCNSDAVAAPPALFERFINADCQDCWSDARTPAPGAAAALLDWIVPSPAGDEAPLSAAARRDALVRLQSIGRSAPHSADTYVATTAAPLPGRLRIALGPVVNDYVTGIVSYRGALPRAASEQWSTWMALVESIPAGADGTAVPRNLVRNLFQVEWTGQNHLRGADRRGLPRATQWIERRPMQIAEGAHPERLGLVAWMEDSQGRVVATALALCGG